MLVFGKWQVSKDSGGVTILADGNFALVELSQCIKPSVGPLHYVVAVYCPSEVLGKMDTEELKCRDLFNIGSTNRDWARNATIVVKKVNSHGLAFTGI